MDSQQKTIVVTGGAGYLGSVLIPLLIEKGYKVKVIDRFFFGKDTLPPSSDSLIKIEADTRWYPKELLDGAYAVMDLASLSNDPAGELDRERTLDINFHSRVRTAKLAKAAGVERYILASSCSVYGFQDGLVDESATPAPITTYAQASLLAEQGVLPLADDAFCVTVLRQGTLYGFSPRMRFDVVVNTMTNSLNKDGFITIRGGEQWRPLVHVADSARAFIAVLESTIEKVRGETFNVGSTSHNFKIADIAEHVLRGAGGKGKIVHEKTAVDTRSYSASSDKIASTLGFVPRSTPEDGAREVMEKLQTGELSDNMRTRTIDWYKELLNKDKGVLDREFLDATTF